MIVISGALVLVALVLLVLGITTGLAFIYASIAVSLLALAFLVIGVRQRRGEPLPVAVPAGAHPGAQPVESPVDGPVGAGEHGGEDDGEDDGEGVRVVPPAAAADDRAGYGPAGPQPVHEERRVDPDAGAAAPVHGAATVLRDEPPVEDDDVEDEQLEGAGTVLVVAGRPRYHLPGCRYLTGRTVEEVDVLDARDEGFTPCGVCKPDAVLLRAAPGPGGEPDLEPDLEPADLQPGSPRPGRGGSRALSDVPQAGRVEDEAPEPFLDPAYASPAPEPDRALAPPLERSEEDLPDGAAEAGDTDLLPTGPPEQPRPARSRAARVAKAARAPAAVAAVAAPVLAAVAVAAERSGRGGAAAPQAPRRSRSARPSEDEGAAPSPAPAPVAADDAAQAAAEPPAASLLEGQADLPLDLPPHLPAATAPDVAPDEAGDAALAAPPPATAPAGRARSAAAARAAAADSTEAAAAARRRGTVVVIPDRGRYHRPDCRYVRGAAGAVELTRAQAGRQGFEPCGVCKP